MSEALIFTPTNLQYDDRFFIELQVQYMKILSSNLGRTCCVQFLYTTCSPMFCKRRASDKDLPVCTKAFWTKFSFCCLKFLVQVNLCQKLLCLHQLTHNINTDCSLFMKIVSSEYLQNMLSTQIVVFVLIVRTILVHNMFCRCCELLKKIYLYKKVP